MLLKSGICVFVCIVLGISAGLTLSVSALHINTTAEGLLSEDGCYIGAYLGGNQGINSAHGVNYFHKAQTFPYESQYLENPADYGHVDTGIAAFRSAVDGITAGSGHRQVLFSRYYLCIWYPDNSYEKVAFQKSPRPDDWAETVIRRGGVPVVVLDPYSLVDNGVLSLDVKSAAGMTGKEILKDLASNLNVICKKYPDDMGRPATVMVCFALEFNTHNEVNPSGDDTIDSPQKQAFRRVFREAYTILHQYGGDNIQVIWAGNEAGTKADREHYWPGNDDHMNPLGQDSVDWVGMTAYAGPYGINTLDQMQGFYDYYARDRNHPFIFVETSADTYSTNPADQDATKAAHVTYLYNTSTLSPYPLIKGIVWFNVAKGEGGFTKNFLLPDGQWIDHGETTAGTVNSSAAPSKAMLPLYPDAVNDSYFIPSPDPLYGLPGVPLEPPVSGFAADVVWGTVPLKVNFTDQSSGVVDAWYWDVDNDGVIDAFTPDTSYVYTVPGNYSVTLTVSSAGGAHTSGRMISAVEPVTANFTAAPTLGQIPLQVAFTDLSLGEPDQWAWSFGDGSPDSTGQNPLHTYRSAGKYTVSLNVSKTGAGAIMTKVDYILAYAPSHSDNSDVTGIERSATATVVLPTGTPPAGEATPAATTVGAQQPSAAMTPAPVPSVAGTESPAPPATQKSPPLIFVPVPGLALLLLLGKKMRR